MSTPFVIINVSIEVTHTIKPIKEESVVVHTLRKPNENDIFILYLQEQ